MMTDEAAERDAPVVLNDKGCLRITPQQQGVEVLPTA
jgi:hypothetical protein